MRRTDPAQNYNRTLKNTTEIVTDDNVFTGLLSYQGQFAGRLRLYGDFSCNYYYNLIENEYKQNEAANYLREPLKTPDSALSMTDSNASSRYVYGSSFIAGAGRGKRGRKKVVRQGEDESVTHG